MKNKIILIIIMLLLLSPVVHVVNAQDPGRFCLSILDCKGGDCENGAIDPFIYDVQSDKAVCEVDVYFSDNQILPFFENQCKFGICVFGIPFGPVKVFSYPTSSDIIQITIKINNREFVQMPVIMKNYP